MSDIERAAFVAILKKLEPALSTKDLIPAFPCFCFSKGSIHTYDDQVALRFPFEAGFTGGVKGQVLLPFLDASRAKMMTVEIENTTVHIKAGRAKLDTPVLPESSFIFQIPDTKKAKEFTVTSDFLAALGKASISMGKDPAHPFRLGVTVVFSDTGTLFYASDNLTAIRVLVGKVTEGGEAVILPPRFVELLQVLGNDDPPLKIFVAKEWTEARFTSGLKLFTRNIASVDVVSFEQLFAQLKERAGTPLPIPPGLDRCLQQANVVIKFAKPPVTVVSVTEGKLNMRTQSTAGDVQNHLPFEGELEGSIQVVPEHLLRVLPYVENLTLYPDCLIFTGNKIRYLVSGYTGGSEAPTEG